MELKLKAFLSYLQSKYKAEPEVHDEIRSEISERIQPILSHQQEYWHLETVVMCHIEQIYKRLLLSQQYECSEDSESDLIVLPVQSTQSAEADLIEETSTDRPIPIPRSESSMRRTRIDLLKDPHQGTVLF